MWAGLWHSAAATESFIMRQNYGHPSTEDAFWVVQSFRLEFANLGMCLEPYRLGVFSSQKPSRRINRTSTT